MDFQAGQYVNLDMPGSWAPPAFSLANAPAGREVELNIRIVPGGHGTTWVHQQLKVGDRVTVAGPYGRFFVRKSAKACRSLFMAGGSGLSSPRSR
jgi:phenol hydroxylase P5 protein